MKKIVVFLIVVLSFMIKCHAQDTVQYMNPRYLFNTRQYFPSLGVYAMLGFDWNDICCTVGWGLSGAVVRYPITDSVQVYGISITMDTAGKGIEKYDFDLVLAYMAEDSTMVFIDSASWKPSDHRAFFTYSLVGDGVYYERTVPAFEIYFETPHMLTDTFYIGIRAPMQYPATYFSHDSAGTLIIHGAAAQPTTLIAHTPVWSTIWGGLFPIIQPSRHCDAPSRPRAIVNTITNTVQFELPYAEGDSMTLSIARVGQSPDSGDLYNVTDSVMSVVLPDSGHYEARLRRYCERYGEFLEGAWSAPFPIQIFNTLGIMGSADGSVLTVTPNPASGKVEIDCGMADGTVALLDMQGRTLAELPSSQHVIDISGLPAGAYILRLTAPDIAPTVRKLIIARP